MHAHSSFNFSEILSDKQEKNKDVGYKKIIGAGISLATVLGTFTVTLGSTGNNN